MKILAIETATLAGGVALMDAQRLIAEYRLNVAVHHSERILLAIDHLLKESQTPLSHLDAIAVSIGPGSFTGLRVGLATAKGLATGSGLPLVLVPTLEAMSAAFPYSSCLIAPMLDARRGEVYWALFDTRRGELLRHHRDAATSPEGALEEIAQGLHHKKDCFSGILFVGDGAEKHREMIFEKMQGRAFFPTRACRFPSIASVAELGLALFQKGETISPDLALPRYLRVSTAERFVNHVGT